MNLNFNGSCLLLILILALSPALWCQEENAQENLVEDILNEAAQYLARRDFSSALGLIDKLPPEEAAKTPIRIIYASILNSAGRTADARRIANEIIAADNRNTDALMILADAAAIENKDRERRVLLDRIIVIEPGNVRALNDLGNINIRNKTRLSTTTRFDSCFSRHKR